MREPIVHEVQALYRAVSSSEGMGGCYPALALADDPPNHLWLGLLHYVDARANVRAKAREIADRKKGKGHG